jgi:type III pantothenate kinase
VNLLVDIGNTRLKWAVCSESSLAVGTPIDHADIDSHRLAQFWQTLAQPDYVAIACVAAHEISDTVQTVSQTLWPFVRILKAQSEAERLGVRSAYPEPQKLGVDRWLGMVAAYHHYRKALCVVGCGTAITLDMVDASGQHLGGLIAPGLRLMREALVQGTANLQPVTGEHPFGLASFTDAAIANGTLAAACGLVELALNSQTDVFQLILTGGDASQIASQLPKTATIEPDLVLRGLALNLLRL